MIVVVGGGLAGTVAAARLISLGRDVTLIADRPGATELHGGGWLLGRDHLTRLGLPTDRLEDALSFLQTNIPEMALTEGPFKLLDSDGVVREVDLAPRSHTAHLPRDSVAVDLVGLGQPFAEMCSGYERLEIPWPTWPGAFGRSFAAAAHHLDQHPTDLDELLACLQAALGDKPIPGLLLPPVLGITAVEANRRKLEDALGLPVVEALGTLPSTPGLRLSAALARWRHRLAGHLPAPVFNRATPPRGYPRFVPIAGQPGRYTERRARVRRVDLEHRLLHLADESLTYSTLILATGGPIPGGLLGEALREPLAGLRTTDLPTDWQHATQADAPTDAVLFRAGVVVDRTMRPVGYDQKPLHSNVFAIGDLIAGTDLVADRCGAGAALLSAYLAAEAASEVPT